MPHALIITTAGINCDQELARAFALAGATPVHVHLNTLIADPALIDSYHLIGMPGGFSYGDAIAAGRVMAQLMRQHLYPALVRAIERGVPIFAPCNGFQIAVQLGLLPGPNPGDPWPAEPPRANVTLTDNASARFVDCWSRVDVPANTRCIWTQGLSFDADTGMLPSAHGEGRFIATDDATLDALESRGQIAVRYQPEENPNGSMRDVAGICDASGLVFGLMPHPERFVQWTQHPFWTRLNDSTLEAEPVGLQMFRRAVAYVQRDVSMRNTPNTAVASLGSAVPLQ